MTPENSHLTMRQRLIKALQGYLEPVFNYQSDTVYGVEQGVDLNALLDELLDELRTPDEAMCDAAALKAYRRRKYTTDAGAKSLVSNPYAPIFTAMVDAIKGPAS